MRVNPPPPPSAEHLSRHSHLMISKSTMASFSASWGSVAISRLYPDSIRNVYQTKRGYRPTSVQKTENNTLNVTEIFYSCNGIVTQLKLELYFSGSPLLFSRRAFSSP